MSRAKKRSTKTTKGPRKPKAGTLHAPNHELRASLAADVQAFLDSGKKIEQVPTGYTNQDPLGGRRHIQLTRNPAARKV